MWGESFELRSLSIPILWGKSTLRFGRKQVRAGYRAKSSRDGQHLLQRAVNCGDTIGQVTCH